MACTCCLPRNMIRFTDSDWLRSSLSEFRTGEVWLIGQHVHDLKPCPYLFNPSRASALISTRQDHVNTRRVATSATTLQDMWSFIGPLAAIPFHVCHNPSAFTVYERIGLRLRNIQLRERFPMLLAAVYPVPNEDQYQRDPFQPNGDGFIISEPRRECFPHTG